jgi:hypothetical protein
MNKGELKRKILFDRYSNQLNRLVELGLYEINLKYDKTFICPTCLQQFSEKDLDVSMENYLTLEDAPPKSLGGKANTLSCKKCNNEFGHQIDFHLTERLNELNIKTFLPNTGAKVTMIHKGIEVQGVVKVDDLGSITITHLEKVNHPENLKKYVSKTGKDDIADLKFPASRVDYKRFEVALLKTAYILAFEQYGYPLILNESYNIVREQLLKPDENIYPNGFWSKQSVFDDSNTGVHLIKTGGFEGFQAIFMLKTKSQESGYGVYLPISEKTTNNVIEKFKNIEAGFGLKYESYKGVDYFENDTNLKMCVKFLNNQKK